MTSKTTKAASIIFAWNKENTAKITELYTASGNDNSKAALDKIAVAVGAKSAASVRMKLTSEQAYVKVDKATGAPSKAKVTKIEKVWTLEKSLGLKKDALDGLGNGATMLQLDVLQKAVIATGSPEQVKKAYEALMQQEQKAAADDASMDAAIAAVLTAK